MSRKQATVSDATSPARQILTLEQEFYYPQRDDVARFFFFEGGLLGYSWYVPKGKGYLNIGLGGFAQYFRNSHLSIHQHFKQFLQNLDKRHLLEAEIGQSLHPSGYAYYLSSGNGNFNHGQVKGDRCCLIGDSAGVATIDFAEGIVPSIRSGLLAASSILGQTDDAFKTVPRSSLRPELQWMRPAFWGIFNLSRTIRSLRPNPP
ncbi:hypothetical protein [Lyngbya confervoides]|uniref:Tryptophan halogenase n=1 Tax=Lyngbya confervoides BDU141951 TaxID=1574623 RepID=A0ABD4SZ35_9CYAN|nr:hypothetical protein [Lyngbya confervoides]MCM1981559.1 hypothetical protein [Lyngbya confervoides BDU141951]